MKGEQEKQDRSKEKQKKQQQKKQTWSCHNRQADVRQQSQLNMRDKTGKSKTEKQQHTHDPRQRPKQPSTKSDTTIRVIKK